MKVLFLAALLAAGPALADPLDDSWQICQRHRSVKTTPQGIHALSFDAGFDQCADVESAMMARRAAAVPAKNADDLSKLNEMRQNVQ
jgi:hypothetical protein